MEILKTSCRQCNDLATAGSVSLAIYSLKRPISRGPSPMRADRSSAPISFGASVNSWQYVRVSSNKSLKSQDRLHHETYKHTFGTKESMISKTSTHQVVKISSRKLRMNSLRSRRAFRNVGLAKRPINMGSWDHIKYYINYINYIRSTQGATT